VPSLVDQNGHFHRTEQEFLRYCVYSEVELEFRAQIERAFSYGLEPTHLDSRMGAAQWDEELFRATKKLSEEFAITMRVGYPPRRDALRQAGWMVPDRLLFDTYHVPPGERAGFYRETLKRLSPGVTELIVHCGSESEELTAVCGATAAHRVFDLQFFTAPQTKQFLADEGIICISFKMLHDLHKRSLYQPKNRRPDGTPAT